MNQKTRGKTECRQIYEKWEKPDLNKSIWSAYSRVAEECTEWQDEGI
jgi:hypothetical protein